MKLEFKMSLSLKRGKPAVAEEEDFEHRDTESLVETAEPKRVGFDIPTTGDNRKDKR